VAFGGTAGTGGIAVGAEAAGGGGGAAAGASAAGEGAALAATAVETQLKKDNVDLMIHNTNTHIGSKYASLL